MDGASFEATPDLWASSLRERSRGRGRCSGRSGWRSAGLFLDGLPEGRPPPNHIQDFVSLYVSRYSRPLSEIEKKSLAFCSPDFEKNSLKDVSDFMLMSPRAIRRRNSP